MWGVNMALTLPVLSTPASNNGPWRRQVWDDGKNWKLSFTPDKAFIIQPSQAPLFSSDSKWQSWHVLITVISSKCRGHKTAWCWWPLHWEGQAHAGYLSVICKFQNLSLCAAPGTDMSEARQGLTGDQNETQPSSNTGSRPKLNLFLWMYWEQWAVQPTLSDYCQWVKCVIPTCILRWCSATFWPLMSSVLCLGMASICLRLVWTWLLFSVLMVCL